jgi:hypothetical protein
MRDDEATQIAGIRINSFTSGLVFLAAVAYVLFATKGRETPEQLSPDAAPRPWPWQLGALRAAGAAGAAGSVATAAGLADEAVEDTAGDAAEDTGKDEVEDTGTAGAVSPSEPAAGKEASGDPEASESGTADSDVAEVKPGSGSAGAEAAAAASGPSDDSVPDKDGEAAESAAPRGK